MAIIIIGILLFFLPALFQSTIKLAINFKISFWNKLDFESVSVLLLKA